MRGRGSAAHIAAVAGAALLWSTSFAVTKVVLPYVGEVTLGAIRFLGAALLLTLVCLITHKRLRAPMRTHIAVAAAGLVGITVYFTLENYGVALATATDAVLIVAVYPVITMVAESVLHRQAPAVVNVVGAITAFAGVVLVTLDEPAAESPDRALGILLLALGGVAWTAYNLLVARAPAAVPPNARLGVLQTTALQNLWGGLGFCILIPVLPQGTRGELAPTTAWLIAYLAVGCSALAFLLYTFGLTVLRPGQAVAILNLVPVFGVVSAVLIAGEQLTTLKALGAFIVVAGVALNAMTRPISVPNRGA
ncbi:DMT family transporter [Micropruina sp.]|uniref:DMT family transporter n=1 Tax=Micropruina sp. TaxID=2737536 RepID=UPI0039E4FF64